MKYNIVYKCLNINVFHLVILNCIFTLSDLPIIQKPSCNYINCAISFRLNNNRFSDTFYFSTLTTDIVDLVAHDIHLTSSSPPSSVTLPHVNPNFLIDLLYYACHMFWLVKSRMNDQRKHLMADQIKIIKHVK